MVNSGSRGAPVIDWRQSYRVAAGVLLPVRCALCGRDDWAVCPDCRASLVPTPLRRSAMLSEGADHLPVHAAAPYAGAIAEALVALKAAGSLGLVHPLGAALAVAILGTLAEPSVRRAVDEGHAVHLIAAPSSRRALRERGYVPVRRMLRIAWRTLPYEVRGLLRSAPARSLVLQRQTADQSALGREQRRQNVHGAMRAGSGCAGLRVIFVDDIVTTGATLREAVRAIEVQGGRVLAAAAVASTERWER